MVAYKLFRVKKNGKITSLYINKTEELPYNVWLTAKEIPTKGFSIRKGWHCTASPKAPHLSMKNRVWKKVEIQDFYEFNRPKNQGGKWLIANKIKIL